MCKAKVDEAEGQKAAMDDHVRTLKVSIETFNEITIILNSYLINYVFMYFSFLFIHYLYLFIHNFYLFIYLKKYFLSNYSNYILNLYLQYIYIIFKSCKYIILLKSLIETACLSGGPVRTNSLFVTFTGPNV